MMRIHSAQTFSIMSKEVARKLAKTVSEPGEVYKAKSLPGGKGWVVLDVTSFELSGADAIESEFYL